MKSVLVGAALCVFAFEGVAVAGDGPVVVDEGWAKDAGDTRVQALRVMKSGAWVAWSPQWHIFIKHDGASKDDILLVQHYAGSRKVGKPEKCRMKKPPSSYNDQTAYFLCGKDRKIQMKKKGLHKAVLTYASSDGTKFKNFRTLKYNVIQFKSSGGSKPQKGWAIDNDWRLRHASVHRRNNAHADIRVWLKYDRNNRPRPSMHCFFGGKKIASSKQVRKQLEPEYRFYKKNNDTTIIWTQFRFGMHKLALVDDRAMPGAHLISKNPGDYKCNVVSDAEIIKEVSFTVKDGAIQPPKKCGAVPGKGFTFVKLTHKGGDYKHDKKAYKKHAFWGLGGCTF